MADSPNDVSNRSQGESSTGNRRNQTIVMSDDVVGTPSNASPESQVVRQLDKASSLLLQAASTSGSKSSEEEPELDEGPGKTEVIEAADCLPAGQDPTIEEYMAALLVRTGNQERNEDPSRQDSPTAPSTESAPPASATARPRPQWSQKPAPECRDAISGMRELANMNARSTFNTHSGQSLVFQMHGRLFVALVAIIVSFALITFCPSGQSLPYYAAVIALIAGCAWTVKYFSLARQLAEFCANAELLDDAQA